MRKEEGQWMPVMEIRVTPVGTESASFSSYVTEACRAIEAAGLKYDLTATGTVVEGNRADLFAVAQKVHGTVLDRGAPRVVTEITIDERRDRPVDMETMVEAVQERLPAARRQQADVSPVRHPQAE